MQNSVFDPSSVVEMKNINLKQFGVFLDEILGTKQKTEQNKGRNDNVNSQFHHLGSRIIIFGSENSVSLLMDFSIENRKYLKSNTYASQERFESRERIYSRYTNVEVQRKL